jgi:hypothetical protein
MPKKIVLIFIKYYLEKYFSLSHHIMKGEKKKEYTHPFLQPPHPTPPKNNSLKNKKSPTFLP